MHRLDGYKHLEMLDLVALSRMYLSTLRLMLSITLSHGFEPQVLLLVPSPLLGLPIASFRLFRMSERVYFVFEDAVDGIDNRSIGLLMYHGGGCRDDGSFLGQRALAMQWLWEMRRCNTIYGVPSGRSLILGAQIRGLPPIF